MDNSFQNSTIAQILEAIISQVNFDGESISNIGDILLSILEQTPYDKEPKSVLAELFLKLKNKLEGEPFEPYDNEPKTVIAEILLSILNETEYTDPPTSRIGELLLELKAELESYAEITTSGPIANFTTSLIKPLVNLTAFIVAQQESGTPTPQGPKAINGVSSVTVTQADENMQAVVSEVINLGGTYYGGYISQDKDGKREFFVTNLLYTFIGNERIQDVYSRNNGDKYATVTTNSLSGIQKAVDNQTIEVLSNSYGLQEISPNGVYVSATFYGFYGASKNNSIRLCLPEVLDASGFTNWLTTYKPTIVYPLETPFTVDLPDGEPIITLNGVNNIYNDSGDTSVTYLALISDNITRGAKMRAVKKAEKIKLIEQEKQPVIIDPIETKETKDTKAEG